MIRIIANAETTMVHYPNGRIKFLSVIELSKLLWYAVFNRVKVVIEDGEKK